MAERKKTSKKKVLPKKTSKTKKEKISEIFEVEKDGKEKIVNTKSVQKVPISSQNQNKHQNIILRNILISIAVFVVLLLIGWYSFNSMSNFTYRGVDFKLVHEGDLLLYNTKLPVKYQGEKAEYNFYLRNDPRDLDKIPFNGDTYIRPIMVLNSTYSFSECGTKTAISIPNVIQLYKILGTEVIKDENATCDPNASYVHINIQKSNETSIDEYAPACYNINVKDCDILEATERFMTETFVEVQSYL